MVVDVAKLSAGREDYYLREIAEDHEAYLSGHGETPGVWYGAGAARLGQAGEASTEAFQRIFEGRHPDTGELLGRAHRRNAVPAFDLVFRPTKSVALLYALGDVATSRAVLDGHHAGLGEAVAYLDEHLGARRGHGGSEHVWGVGCWRSGLTTAPPARGIRCPTPTWRWPTGPRARTGAGRPRRLPAPAGRGRHLPGRLPARTHQDPRGGVDGGGPVGNRELVGVPTELVRAFSKRTEQVEAEVQRLEADGRERRRGW